MAAQNINRNTRTTQGQQDPSSAVVVEAPRVNPGTLDPNSTGAPVDPATYVIGPLDILAVKVFRDNDFSGQYQVRPDGKITLQLIGDMQAAGLTPERLGAQIKQALSDYLIKPDVVVQIYQV